ncbi:Vesicle-mediated transport protein (Imh1) [Penicillium lagena]|uniref:Vesicle-mediated transport protein (Imh1) n=1 Tax=Penicillium lagena TaxID=94218 RepID=UPI0025418F9B|nr:Vesicle-mediated transport protein (Imh1) [Penicillium lagena]KAJ5618808.1 Vesicle-mediated transport protein (Imh1) [Penicillium lagena]
MTDTRLRSGWTKRAYEPNSKLRDQARASTVMFEPIGNVRAQSPVDGGKGGCGRRRRLRDAIDSRIAEEQARQKTAQDNVSRSASGRRTATSRNLSPGRRPQRPRRTPSTPIRGPDPKEFEPEFAIGDDESSGTATPQAETLKPDSEVTTLNPGAEGEEQESKAPAASSATGDAAAPDTEPNDEAAPELPTEVRAKLRRLEKLEPRYHELLKAYRVAHARVLSIEPFEAALRENTPLSSIAEPKALTEYLNQSTLKSDMVMEELKRVSTEKDDYKKKLEEAEKSAKEIREEMVRLKKDKPEDEQIKLTDEGQETSEEFFSFENEIPRLEGELKERQEEVNELKSQVETLKRDLSVAQESTEGMVQNLESATRELVELRDTKDRLDAEIDSLKTSKETDVDDLKAKLGAAESSIERVTAEVAELKTQLQGKAVEIERLQAQASQSGEATETAADPELAAQLEKAKEGKEASEKRLGVLQGLVDSLRSQLKDTESSVFDLKAEINDKSISSTRLQNIVDWVDVNLKDHASWISAKEKVSAGQTADFEEVRKSLAPATTEAIPATPEAEIDSQTQSTAAANAGAGAGKKKNKKKKKGGKAAEESPKPSNTTTSIEQSSSATSGSSDLVELKQTIEILTQQLAEKESAIERLSSKLKGEDDLKEEIESLRDDLVNVGQEHVEAKDKIKELSAEKSALEETIGKLEKELVDLRTNSASSTADSAKVHGDLKDEFERLKVQAATLETDLSAAQQLAAARFKDLTDLRDTLQKIQPELRNLRADSSELKTMKETLSSKTSELKALEGKHEDLQIELKNAKSKITERESEVKTLNKKVRQETDSRLKAEENLTVARSNLRSAESKAQEAINAKEKTATDLSKVQDGLKGSRAKVQEMEEQISQLNKDLDGLREEIELKTAQHSSAQSLMNSMRDQTAEMAMQMKEARERCDSLEEELADAHRLLSERTREGETMRRLLNDIESRAEAKVRDSKERLEQAIEERDRAEDEASTHGRRRAREIEELKGKIREAERALRTVEQDKEELEYSQKDWRRRRDELESLSERSTQEVSEIRQAMAGLREALDEREKQVRDLEKERAELRRSVEETNSRLERLRRSHKTLGEDVRLRSLETGRQSSRSSMDSRGVTSPSGQDRSVSAQRSETPPTAGSTAQIDYMYLKNVLLQFLEQKDKNYQKQLIPVLGMLLHFDRADEQKLISLLCNSDPEAIFLNIPTTPMTDTPTIRLATAEGKFFLLSLGSVRGTVYTALITPPPSAEQPSPIPVGMALFFYNYSTWRAAPGIYLEDLYVQPSARGHGYGFKLLKYLAQKVVEVRGRRLEWSVLRWNKPSIDFYERVGAKGMEEWMKMMVEGEALDRLAAEV